jgi:hypothetical protein
LYALSFWLPQVWTRGKVKWATWCQFSPGMGPSVFGYMGPLVKMTLGESQAKNRLTIRVY